MKLARGLVLVIAGLLACRPLQAAEIGAPRPWEWWHQQPATPLMNRIDALHLYLFLISVAICGLVFALLIYVLVRYNARRNPVPSATAHNTLIEVIWTVVPVLVLVTIAIPSFRLLYYEERVSAAEMTLKITGRQWFWEYQYPDHGNFTITSLIIPDEEIKPGQQRLLEVDNRVVLPVDTTVRFLITGGDVLHSWAIPSFGVKRDAVPGRTNETWARIPNEGVYYGQCSEICGTGHAYMPIAIEVVSKEKFAEWVENARAEFGDASQPGQRQRQPTRTASSRIEGDQQ